MKKLSIIMFLFLITAISCSKQDDKGKLNPNAMISIRAEGSTKSQLANIEIVRQAYDLSFYNEEAVGHSGPLARGIIDAHRDEVNVRLLMWGTDIIDQHGNFVIEFIAGRDFVFRRRLGTTTPAVMDTIAYIPQSVIVAARTLIKQAYDQGDYRTVYDLFDNAFTFRPTTGEQWRALKAQGKN